MTQRKPRRGRRPAFTLIELLVVIAIIAILMALTGAAVMRVLIKGPEMTAKAELREFEQRLNGVMNPPSGALPFLPSRLHLSKKNNYPNRSVAGSLDQDSIAYLQARFGGRHACYDFQPLPANGPSLNWNGDNVADEELILEGEQCLVFHLGGVPQIGSGGTVGMTGFSNNIQDPTQVGGTRQQPSFEFQTNRLVLMNCTGPAPYAFVAPPYTQAIAQGTFPVYKDPYSLPNKPYPYAFFAPVGGAYNKYAGTYGSDCASLGVSPYVQSSAPTTVYVNANGFQILSSGRDGKFGAGNTNWSPTTGTSDANGSDDLSNFSKSLLGGPPN